MASKLDIPLHGHSVNIVRQCGLGLTTVLESKFGCMATINGVDFEGDPSTAQLRRPTVVPEQRLAVVLHSGVRVSVWKADLTSLNFPVDAVVNAANERLEHHGGLAQALSKAGGPQIQKESDDYIQKHGALQTGDAVLMGAGILPCKNIIHAVGPHLFTCPSANEVARAEPQLQKAIQSILDIVRENHLQSVAIPAISSGLFHYPLVKCANAIVTTVKRYYENSSGRTHPKEIFLVNNDEPTVKEMERACRQILAPHLTMTYSQAAAQSKSRDGARTSTPTVQIGNVHLTLKTGKIEEQQTDVIVNTTTYDRNLSSGQISNAVLQKAGHEMQDEIMRATKSGHVIATKPYRLQCKQVYHTFCIEKGNNAAQHTAAKETLFRSVSQCLWCTAFDQHKSIAFPAIGTGGLRFSKKEAAEIMLDAVADFAQKNPQKMEVYFVIFPSDNHTFEAFKKQMKDLQQKTSHPSFTLAVTGDLMMSSPPAFGQSDDYHSSRAPTPQISLTSLSDEAVREADRWLHGLLFKSSGTITICNNFIQHFGEPEHLQLSRLIQKGVFIEEFFMNGHAGIIVNGESREDVAVAGLQVEAMLCSIRAEFVREEERAMLPMSIDNVSFERKTVDFFPGGEFSDRSAVSRLGLQVKKVDKVVNPALERLFHFKKEQLGCSIPPQKMYQLIPVQFCEMVCHIGFHAEYAPPEDPAYGEGIYFAGTVKEAMEVWPKRDEEYLYFVEAEVLTGKSTPGKPGLILPPAVGTDPHIVYDSVSGGADVAVIFSGYQALPKYIITCKMI